MANMWGVRNDTLSTELLDEGFISIGWDELGDLRQIGLTRDALKAAITRAHPDDRPMATANRTGVLLRFAAEMAEGDVIVAPYKPDGTINIGVVVGPYEYVADVPTHRNRRRVRWEKVGVSRSVFTAGALQELGSLLTVFGIRRHSEEFLAVMNAGGEETFEAAVAAVANTSLSDAPVPTPILDENGASTEPRASHIERHTRDYVLKTLKNDLTHREFEEFTAALLQAMGYQARVTVYSNDGGIDVIAHRDALGVKPPVLKVQCKHMTTTIGAPEVQQLIGTQAQGELSVFVTLGGYSREALAIERQRQGVRLITGEELVDLVLHHYDRLEPAWRLRIPLRAVLVVDDIVDI